MKLKHYRCTAIWGDFKIVERTLRAADPTDARKRMRAKFRRGSLTGHPITVDETSNPKKQDFVGWAPFTKGPGAFGA